LWDTNVQGTMILLTAAEQHGVKKVIYVSSSSVIGARPGNAPGDESTPAGAARLKNLYSKSKALAEDAIDAFLARHALPVVLILPSAMFGPGDSGPTSTGRLVQDFLARKIPGIVDGGLSVVDARDIAQIMLTAVEKGKSGERYTIPLSYVQEEDIIFCITGHASWWRNLRGGAPVKVMLKGQARAGMAQAIVDDPAVIMQGLQKLLHAIPGDAKYHKVKLDLEGQPDTEDMAQAASSSILIRIQLTS
jgi:hypothetical protein